MCDECACMAPQNIPSATILTLGNKVLLYCIIGVYGVSEWELRTFFFSFFLNLVSCLDPTSIASHLDSLVVDVPVTVKSCHGCLQHTPCDSLGCLRWAHNHDGVTRCLGFIQLNHLGNCVVVHLQ